MIRGIALSLDAPPELNDHLRGKGATQSIVSAIENLKAEGFAGKLEIMSTVTSPTIPELSRLRSFIGELHVPLWRLSLVMPIGRAANRPDLIPNAQEIRTLLEYILSARKDSITPHPEFCEECFLGNRFEGNVRPYLNQCLSGICVGGIMSNGGIGACPELGEAFIQGNIRKERFKDVWDTKYQVFRDRLWTHKDDCAGCNHYRHCKGSGLHLYATPDSKLMRCLYSMAKRAESELCVKAK